MRRLLGRRHKDNRLFVRAGFTGALAVICLVQAAWLPALIALVGAAYFLAAGLWGAEPPQG